MFYGPKVRPVNVFQCARGRKFEFEDQTTFSGLVRSKNARERNVAVYCFCGKPNSGKTLVLNMMVDFLEQCCLNPEGHINWDAWLPKPGNVKAFDWTKSKDGVWVYPKVFLTTTSDNKKIGIVLMECNSPPPSHELFESFGAMSTLTSSVLVYTVEWATTKPPKYEWKNLIFQVGSKPYQRVMSFVGGAKPFVMEPVMHSGAYSEQPFQTMVVLMQNCPMDDDLLVKLYKNGRNQPAFKVNLILDIPDGVTTWIYPKNDFRTLFEDVSIFLMPNPGEGSNSPAAREFNGKTTLFAYHLFHDCCVPKKVGTTVLKVKDLLVYMLYWERAISYRLTGTSVTSEYCDPRALQRTIETIAAVRDCIDTYEDAMLMRLGWPARTVYTVPEELEGYHKMCKSEAVTLFTNNKQAVLGPERLEQYQRYLNGLIDKSYAKIKMQNRNLERPSKLLLSTTTLGLAIILHAMIQITLNYDFVTAVSSIMMHSVFIAVASFYFFFWP